MSNYIQQLYNNYRFKLTFTVVELEAMVEASVLCTALCRILCIIASSSAVNSSSLGPAEASEDTSSCCGCSLITGNARHESGEIDEEPSTAICRGPST